MYTTGRAIIVFFFKFFTTKDGPVTYVQRQFNGIGAERGFSFLARAAKPSETEVVHQSGHPSQY